MPSMTATTIETIDEWTRMVYHKTCVAEYNPALRQVRLNSGGYRTKTTKVRINQFFTMFALPFSLSQVKGQWIVTQKSLTSDSGSVNFTLDFVDGMEIDY